MNSRRRPLVAGNWKMHRGGPSGVELAAEVVRAGRDAPHVDIVIAPPFTALAACAHECDGSRVDVAGQNLYPKDSGAFTGEISALMLLDAGCSWVIVGHSERRQHFAETDAFVAQKTAAAMAAGLVPIVCVGETLAEREEGRTLAVIERQVARISRPSSPTAARAVAIAYEPVWAIGTGKNAGPAEAQEVHAAIRGWLGRLVRGAGGGHAHPLRRVGQARQRARPSRRADVDGALVGGASLDAASFARHRARRERSGGPL